MSIKLRKRFKMGPLVINATQNGLTSWGLQVGAWSWNNRTGKHRVNLPGPLSWQSGGRRRSRGAR